MKKQNMVRLRATACVAGSVLLYLALTVISEEQGPVVPDGVIVREGYGQGGREYQIYVEGLEAEAVPITVTVGARAYREDEAEAVFEIVMEGMEERIRGENPSLAEVNRNLILPSALEEYGIRLRWYPENPDWMRADGTILNIPKFEPGQEREWMKLGVRLSDGTYNGEYEMTVGLVPPDLTAEQARLDGLKQEIKQREERQRTEAVLSLPMEYEGKTLHYRTEETSGYAVLLVLGVLLAVLCYAKAYTEVREVEKKRERELLLDYAELVSKLMVYTGAGMTVRLSWERMVQDYEGAVQAGRQKKRAAYEEMARACYQMQKGISEGEAIQEFGKSCRLQPYLKLSSLLEQNRKTGTKNLRAILQTEVSDAWEQRKNLARRLGEEAGTKLLLPLFLMLGIVMVMIMVPAMMTMG